ncbi:hypothetical protein [Amycolatopsis echigonensis]|uniref:MFS transporter n=1 Tax=Amycolatopsis echigonensis TaxID=2576905 RepID=A0A8E1VXS5_9PSEU|nr:hypothetical protein [Amycolatopsis echigonensis]MBB2500203.1 hypothetical protein [Amycolatopsis echigonensis]
MPGNGRSSLYNTFGSKGALFAECLARHLDATAQAIVTGAVLPCPRPLVPPAVYVLAASVAVFLAGNVLAALATTCSAMVVARGDQRRRLASLLRHRDFPVRATGRRTRARPNGLMLGTLLGLPLATFAGGHYGWRAAFGTITLLTVLAAPLTQYPVRDPVPSGRPSRGKPPTSWSAPS